MVVLHTLAALAMTAVVLMACPLQRFSRFSIPGPLAMKIGDKVVPQDNDVVPVTTQAPKLGTFERLSGSFYTAITVQPYGILVDSMDSNLLWLQSDLKPSATPTNFETSEGFFRVYELLNNDNKPVFAWTPSNLQGPEHASVLTLLFDTSNISPQDKLYLQNAALNPSRFNFVNTMEQTSLADKVAAGALFLATADSTKPSSAAKTAYRTLLKALNLSEGAQAPLLNGRSSEAYARPEEAEGVTTTETTELDSWVPQATPISTVTLPVVFEVPPSSEEPNNIVSPVVHLDQHRPVTTATTATPTLYYPAIMTTGKPDWHSSASHNRMTVFGLVSMAAMLFAL